MSRAKGYRAQGWLAAYLRQWWPDAEAAANGRAGPDILKTPGAVFEVKTAVEWRHKALAQVARYARPGELAAVVYYPPGCGAESTADALAILPLSELMRLAEAAGHAPARQGDALPDGTQAE